MRACDIMTKDPLTVGESTSLDAALGIMVYHRVSGVPVVDGARRLVGILTEGDLLRRIETETDGGQRSRFMEFLLGYGRSAAHYIETHSRTVGDLMTRDVLCVQRNAHLQEVVDLMERRHIRRVPVLDGDLLEGIVSRHDLMRALAAKLEPAKSGESDDALERRLRTELENQSWLSASNVSIAVRDHTVILEGFVYDDRVHDALKVSASNLAEGIKVDDRLVWADPNGALLAAI